jgi:uncharacterized protein (DUF927 family)
MAHATAKARLRKIHAPAVAKAVQFEIVDPELPASSADKINCDDSADNVPPQAAAEMLAEAGCDIRDPAMPPGFRLGRRGMEKCIITKEGVEWFWFCGILTVLALVRDFSSRAWSLLVELVDADGRHHQLTLPRAMIINDSTTMRERLADAGLMMLATGAARTALATYLSLAEPRRRVTMVQQLGWHDKTFVLPDGAFGAPVGTEVCYQGGGSHNFREAGTLDEWQAMAGLIVGNSRIVLALCVAAAAPLLKLVDGESGGVHIFGASSTGKSTALVVAGSFWGGGGVRGNVMTWRSSDNAMEAVARGHCDSALMVDEIGQAEPRHVDGISYMIANGQGKSRGTRDGGARPAAQWRILMASTGEVTLADKLSEGGKKAKAGQLVRIVDVGLPDEGMGIFEHVPEQFASPAAFANYLQETSKRCYGTACRIWLHEIAEHYDTLAESVRDFIGGFVREHCPHGADGQVQRVAARFGMLAAAGELLTEMGIVPWGQGDATDSIACCLAAWIGQRGGIHSSESMMATEQVLERLDRFGTKHFDEWQKDVPGGGNLVARVQDRLGFRCNTKNGPEYWVTPRGWRNLCEGYDAKKVAQELIRRGIMEAGKNGKSSVVKRIPTCPDNERYYHVLPGAMTETDREHADAE